MAARARANCKASIRTGQAQGFDSNSRWVPILLYTMQQNLARRTTVSEHHSTNLIDESHDASHPQLAHSQYLKRSQRSSAVVDAPTPEIVARRCEKGAPVAPERSSFRVIALPTRTSFCFLSSGPPRATKEGKKRANKRHPQKLRCRLSCSPSLVAERERAHYRGAMGKASGVSITPGAGPMGSS